MEVSSYKVCFACPRLKKRERSGWFGIGWQCEVLEEDVEHPEREVHPHCPMIENRNDLQ